MQQAPAPARHGGEGTRLQPANGRGRDSGDSAPRREPARNTSLPSAEVPWNEPDTIENEIVQAFRLEPHPPLPQARHPAPSRQEAQPPRAANDPTTTLGDLAERLEEALAREVHAANQERGRLELGLDAFVEEEPPVVERPPERTAERPHERTAERQPERVPERAPERMVERPAERSSALVRDRSEPRGRLERERMDTRAIAPAPEPEPRREMRTALAERPEEAPVINLNARRREAVDPLEDEMARLLGELTGDSGRR
jgi:hypothetical protein